MGTVDAGALLFSAWLEALLQPHHCRIKDWRYSQAATILVCDVILRLILRRAVCCDDGRGWVTGGCVAWKGARFELLLLIADSGGVGSNVVDIFDVSSGRWSTAVLSVGRYYLAATSLPNQGLAIFAGGSTGL